MPIVYKMNVLDALKKAGYNTNKIRKEKIMGESMLQKLRQGYRCPPGSLLAPARTDGVLGDA